MVRHFAWETARMSGEVDQAHGFTIAGRYRYVPTQVLFKGVGELHGSTRHEGCEDLTRERFRDGANTKHGLLARTDPCSFCLPKARYRALRTTDRADHQTRDLVLQKQHCAGELYGVLQQPILRSCALQPDAERDP